VRSIIFSGTATASLRMDQVMELSNNIIGIVSKKGSQWAKEREPYILV